MAARRVLIPAQLDDIEPPIGAELYELGGKTMGTTWSVRLAGPRGLMPDMLRLGIERQLAAVIADMSPWEPDSLISRFNRAEAGSWHELSADFVSVLSTALSLAEASDGAFDPAIGTLVEAWGFGPGGLTDHIPEPEVVAAAAARSGWQRLPAPDGTRLCQPGGLALDFSGIAKGFAVDKVSDYLAAQDFLHHLVEIGGELRGRGLRPDGHPWWVMLEAPAADAGAVELPETVVALHQLSVATSGDYRRFFMQDGQRYAHTLDPRLGRPVPHALASVTVLHPQCMLADAHATLMTVLGPEAGLDWAERQGLPALLLARDDGSWREYRSTALAAMLD